VRIDGHLDVVLEIQSDRKPPPMSAEHVAPPA
jgi:hypothetical protein